MEKSISKESSKMFSMSGGEAVLDATGYEQQLISGECAISQLGLTEVAGQKFGVWQVSPGEFRSSWEDWEAFTIIAGRGVLVDGTGERHELVPGALIVIPPGSTGTWNVTETLRKTYVYPAGSIGR